MQNYKGTFLRFVVGKVHGKCESKCFVLHMSHKKNPWLTTYNMMDVPLESTSAQKYLGVEITSSHYCNHTLHQRDF